VLVLISLGFKGPVLKSDKKIKYDSVKVIAKDTLIIDTVLKKPDNKLLIELSNLKTNTKKLENLCKYKKNNNKKDYILVESIVIR